MAAVALPGPSGAVRRRSAVRRGLSAAWYAAHQQRRVWWYTAFAVVAAALLGAAVLRVGAATVVLPVAGVAVAAILWRPQVGLFTLIALNLLFEMSSPDPLMLPGRYLHFGLQSSLGISGFIASPLELLLIFMAVVWLIRGMVGRNLSFRGGDLGWPAVLFFTALILGLARGSLGGGDMYVAFWEVRSLLYLGVAYVLATNLIRTRHDVAVLVVLLLVMNGIYAFEAVFRYLVWIRADALGVAPEFNYSHEVVIFLAVLILQGIVQVVVGGPLWRRIFGLLLLPLGMVALLATGRRAGSIALAIAFLMMTIPWLVRHRKAVLLILVPAVIGASIYLPIFWNNTGILGQPARAVRSMTDPDARDASSNEYRDLELVNVRETIRADPVLGVGFGRPFTFYVPLPDLSWWPFWHYQPHHNILWMWLKIGAPGFAIFLLLMMSALALSASRALSLSDPTLVTFAYIALVSIVTTLVFCYVDLGLTNGRVTLYLGVILGVLAVLQRIDHETAAASPGSASAQPTPPEPPVARPQRGRWRPRPPLPADGPHSSQDAAPATPKRTPAGVSRA